MTRASEVSTVGLHDIGKWNDIDIGVQYCDIDITHDIYEFNAKKRALRFI